MRTRTGMTLVEVVVVVSILGVLSAMLLPALGRARQQAHSMVCVNNLRQLFMANTMYARENNDRYVRAAPDINEGFGGRVRWHGVRKTTDGESDFDPTLGPLAEYLADSRVQECPVFIEFKRRDQISNAFESGTGGYGYNSHYVGGSYHRRDWEDAPKLAARASGIFAPSETIMFADAAMPLKDGLIEYGFIEAPHFATPEHPFGNPDFGLASPSIHFRHYDRANVMWCDGHASCEKWEWAPRTNIFKGNNFRWNVGWFGPKNNYYFAIGRRDRYVPKKDD